MGFLFELFFYMMVAALVFHLLTKKFLNPFKFTMVVGKKGSGKTTWGVKLAYTYMKRGYKVYANFDIPGVHYFDPLDIGKYTFPEYSIVIIDEMNRYWDNRKWKDTMVETIEWFRYERQYKVKLYGLSQTYDIDPKLRRLTDDLYLAKNVARVFCWYKRVLKWPDLRQAEGEGEARIVDMIKYESLLMAPFGSRKICYIPKWSKYFQSYSPPPLPIIPSEYKWDPDRAPAWLIRRRKLRQLIDLRKERMLRRDQQLSDPEETAH